MISNANPIELAKFLDAAVTYKTSNVQPSYATAASKEAQVELVSTEPSHADPQLVLPRSCSVLFDPASSQARPRGV